MIACTYRILIVVLLIGMLPLSSCSEKSVDGGNRPPAAPSSPSPADGAGGQPPNVRLSWECSDPDGDALTYDVCLGTVMDPPVVAAGLDTNTRTVGTLEESTYYYWRIIARDERNNVTEGPLWTFSTGVIPAVYYILTYNHPQRIYDYWVEDGLLYLVTEEGLDIVDALRLAEPTLIGSYVPSDTGVHIGTVFIQDNYAYLSSCFGGMQIVDISDPYNPMFVGDYSWEYPSCTNSVFADNTLVYIATEEPTAGLLIVDVSNPVQPVPLGSYECPWPEMIGWEIIVNGTHAYYRIAYRGEGLSDYVLVMNVSDPAHPFLETYIFTADYARNIFFARDCLYVPYAYDHVLRIFDVSDPSNPQIISEYPGERFTSGVFVQDNYAYAIMGARDMHVIDVSDPASPQFVTAYATERQAYDVFVEGEYVYLFDSDGESESMNILWFVH